MSESKKNNSGPELPYEAPVDNLLLTVIQMVKRGQKPSPGALAALVEALKSEGLTILGSEEKSQAVETGLVVVEKALALQERVNTELNHDLATKITSTLRPDKDEFNCNPPEEADLYAPYSQIDLDSLSGVAIMQNVWREVFDLLRKEGLLNHKSLSLLADSFLTGVNDLLYEKASSDQPPCLEGSFELAFLKRFLSELLTVDPKTALAEVGETRDLTNERRSTFLREILSKIWHGQIGETGAQKPLLWPLNRSNPTNGAVCKDIMAAIYGYEQAELDQRGSQTLPISFFETIKDEPDLKALYLQIDDENQRSRVLWEEIPDRDERVEKQQEIKMLNRAMASIEIDPKTGQFKRLAALESILKKAQQWKTGKDLLLEPLNICLRVNSRTFAQLEKSERDFFGNKEKKYAQYQREIWAKCVEIEQSIDSFQAAAQTISSVFGYYPENQDSSIFPRAKLRLERQFFTPAVLKALQVPVSLAKSPAILSLVTAALDRLTRLDQELSKPAEEALISVVTSFLKTYQYHDLTLGRDTQPVCEQMADIVLTACNLVLQGKIVAQELVQLMLERLPMVEDKQYGKTLALKMVELYKDFYLDGPLQKRYQFNFDWRNKAYFLLGKKIAAPLVAWQLIGRLHHLFKKEPTFVAEVAIELLPHLKYFAYEPADELHFWKEMIEILEKAGRYDLACFHLPSLIKLNEKIRGEHDESSLELRKKLVHARIKTGQWELAQKLASRLTADYENMAKNEISEPYSFYQAIDKKCDMLSALRIIYGEPGSTVHNKEQELDCLNGIMQERAWVTDHFLQHQLDQASITASLDKLIADWMEYFETAFSVVIEAQSTGKELPYGHEISWWVATYQFILHKLVYFIEQYQTEIPPFIYSKIGQFCLDLPRRLQAKGLMADTPSSESKLDLEQSMIPLLTYAHKLCERAMRSNNRYHPKNNKEFRLTYGDVLRQLCAYGAGDQKSGFFSCQDSFNKRVLEQYERQEKAKWAATKEEPVKKKPRFFLWWGKRQRLSHEERVASVMNNHERKQAEAELNSRLEGLALGLKFDNVPPEELRSFTLTFLQESADYFHEPAFMEKRGDVYLDLAKAELDSLRSQEDLKDFYFRNKFSQSLHRAMTEYVTAVRSYQGSQENLAVNLNKVIFLLQHFSRQLKNFLGQSSAKTRPDLEGFFQLLNSLDLAFGDNYAKVAQDPAVIAIWMGALKMIQDELEK